jgi:F-type H+-transporting ATPase subunit b
VRASIARVQRRFFTQYLWLAVLAVVGAGLALPPGRARAQQSPTPGPSQSAQAAQAGNPATTETPQKEEDQINGYLHAPVVQSMARWMHTSTNTASVIFVVINFIIIFLAIAIPVGRLTPRILRKRSRTLKHDLEAAREATEEARVRMGAVEAKLAGLDQDIARFRAEVEQESREDEKRIKATIEEESARILTAAEQEISAATEHAMRALRGFAADLAIERARKQLVVTPEVDRALITEFIGQLGADHEGSNGAATSAEKNAGPSGNRGGRN